MRSNRSFSGCLGSLIVVLAASPGLAGSPAASASSKATDPSLYAEKAGVAPRINRRIPLRLRSTLEAGFEFAHPTIDGALDHLLSPPTTDGSTS